MDILFYSLGSHKQFKNEMQAEEITKYINSTVLDVALNNTIQYMRINAQELDKSVTKTNYKEKLDKYVCDTLEIFRCFDEIVAQILDFYQNNQKHRDENTSLLRLLKGKKMRNKKDICTFFERNGYDKWESFNQDNYLTLEHYSQIISDVESEMLRIKDRFADQPFVAESSLELNDRITVTIKSSAKKCCMELLRCVKQVRQIRWLAWFENFLYLLLTVATATVSPHYKYIVLFPEFFFVDIYDNPVPPKTKVTGYVKPFYEDVARYFTGLHTESPVHKFIEESLHQSRLADLTALYPNMIIFAGTMVWKTKTKRVVYTNGQEVITQKKRNFKKVETDTFFNTAVVFSQGRCCYLWDKQFISKVDGQGGVKVIHRHETPSLSDLHYIKSSMSMEMGMQTPVLTWTLGEENITFLISVCLDFMALSEQNYNPQPDIHILTSAGASHFKDYAKGRYFLLVCDGERTSSAICYDIKNQIGCTPDLKWVFYRFPIRIPDPYEETSYPMASPADSENSFYEKVLNEGLAYHDLTESAAFEAEREEDFIFIDNSVVTEVKITSAGGQSAEGMMTVTEGEDVLSYPMTAVFSVDSKTHERRLELSLHEKEKRSFSLAEILLFSGNMSEGFLNAVSLPLGVPKECKFYFYENGHRTYHLSFQYNMEIPLIPNLLVLKDACIDVDRSDDMYQYTLSSVVDIAGCDIEFLVVSGSLDLVQAYFKPASDERSFPSFAQFAGWALGGQIEDFKNLSEFKLLDLALVSVKAYIRTKEQIAFDEIVVTTRLTLFSLVFSVSVSVIGKCLAGSLETGQEKKSVSDMIGSMYLSGQAPSIPEGLASLYIEQAELYADIKENSYRVSFQMSGIWEEGQISLDDLKMFFASGQGERKVSFEGKMTLFETLTVQVGIVETNGVWTVQGGVFIPEEKSLMDLFSSFGWKVPEIMRRISLQYVSLSVTPETGDCQFECAAKLMLETIHMKFLITARKSKEEVSFRGEMSFAIAGEETFPSHFLVSFENGQQKEALSLEWKQESEFCLTDFCRMLGFEEFELPEFLDISIASLKGSFDFSSKEFEFFAETKDHNKLYIRSGLSDQKRQVIFGIGLGMEISLAKLPIVGDSTPLMKEVGLRGLKTLILSSDCSHLTVEDLGIADGKFQKGVHLFSELYLPDTTVPLNLSIGGGEKKNLLNGEMSENAEEGNRMSIRIDKHIGPISIRKIGLSYSNQSLNFMFDSDFLQGSLMFSLEDLGIGYQIAKKKPSFFLKGLSVLVKSDAFTIGGSFRQTDSNTYRGSLIIGLKSFQLAAYGAYTTQPSQSAFVFALLKTAIGGPPCFSITGIAAGFGYNRNLCLPDMFHLSEFSFLKAVSGKLSPEDIFADEMTYFPPQTGENWIAAGVLFNSFKMIDSIAVLTVQFGNEVEVHLLGESVINVPYQDPNPIAHAVLLLDASFVPASHLIAVEAALSSESYILSKDCHLTGSFAFYTWYGGEHGGDFVVTLGGYHRTYQKPAHYPDARRLGLNWEIAKGLTALGEIYFAMTPSALMAGGLLKLQYTASCMEAWFDAHVDVLIQWKPYHYDLSIGVNIGVCAKLKLFQVKLELGCDLHIWGPKFSGTVKVKVWIISFTISFIYSENQSSGCIEMDEFVSSFLPAAKEDKAPKANGKMPLYSGCTIAVSGGMIREFEIEDDKKAVVLCAQEFEVTVKSFVPAKTISFMEKTVHTHDAEVPMKIRPCHDADLDSQFVIELQRKDGVKIEEEFISTVVTENLPSALWAPKIRKEETIPAATGLIVRLKPNESYQLSYKEDFNRTVFSVCLANPPAIVPKKYECHQAFEYLKQINQENEKRKAILECLGGAFLDLRLECLGADPKEVFVEEPLIATIGGNQLWMQ